MKKKCCKDHPDANYCPVCGEALRPAPAVGLLAYLTRQRNAAEGRVRYTEALIRDNERFKSTKMYARLARVKKNLAEHESWLEFVRAIQVPEKEGGS